MSSQTLLKRPAIRRPVAAVAAAAIAGALLVPVSAVPAVAGLGADLPEGFVDGVPVGEEQPASGADQGREPVGGRPEASTQAKASSTARWFGRGPFDALRAAVAATSRPCTISDDELTALSLAPIFKESAAGTSPSTVPSPMTLSRYDEWTGVTTPDTNANANYGLYAFRDPAQVSYRRAFWHPGIGLWQYDSAGVGAPFTAIERMDVRIVGADVAAGMAARWCNPSPTLIGHPAPFTDAERRASAWAPWGYPCDACEAEHAAMVEGEPFSNLTLVDGISATGGAQARTCTFLGEAGSVPCWYIDPRVGVIEGATAWATLDPTGGPSATVAPTPLSHPFYVVERDGYEERHWLQADTGFDIDISGRRLLGRNARPRPSQPGSGIDWLRSTDLCDATAQRGACLPPAPPGLQLANAQVTGTYRPIALDADGDQRGDVLWYAPGTTPDWLWLGLGSGTFASRPITASGTYDQVLADDLDGDGRDDVLWYSTASGRAYVWRAFDGSSFRSVALAPGPLRRPLLVDRDGDGDAEILWYGPGAIGDHWSLWSGSGFTTQARSVSGDYQPFTGDFDGNGRTDVFWYAPGSAPDAIWFHEGSGWVRNQGVQVQGTYQPIVADLYRDQADEILWYRPGPASDSIWGGGRAYPDGVRSVAVSGTYQPFVADLEGDGRDDLVWYAPGAASDWWWTWSTDTALTSRPLQLRTRHQAVVGAFSSGGADGVLWYQPGPVPEGVWWR